MSVFHRKLCALLDDGGDGQELCDALTCLNTEEGKAARKWWRDNKEAIEAIASSSDRVNLEPHAAKPQNQKTVKHPISGQAQTIEAAPSIPVSLNDIPSDIQNNPDAKTVFWWCWRFLPELRQQQYKDALLDPQHAILPDCPVHSYRATVSALAGAMFDESGEAEEYPYLLLFTFSPVQEFIKASRKFLDFWAGSYLLHYLSAKLCWHIAETYGADAAITPSLWGQEIIDALLLKAYPNFSKSFRQCSTDQQDPHSRFQDGLSTSLATAGFPNTIAVLVDGKEKAEKLGKDLSEKLHEEWQTIANNVRDGIKDNAVPEIKQGIRDRVSAFLKTVEIESGENPDKDEKNQEKIDKILKEFKDQGGHDEQNRKDLKNWKTKSCWEWRKLWDAQIEHTWQPYWTAVPLGDVKSPLEIQEESDSTFDQQWIDAQETVAQTRAKTPPPTEAEKLIYATLNDGTWWGSIQARCANAMQGLKNARTWAIPISPGARSTLSGQLSALHPRFFYGVQRSKDGKTRDFREGYGLSMESMRLFWRIMAEVYPGLFDGSEMLNALELTKRMSWVYGGVADSVGIDLGDFRNNPDYEQFIRFPNLSSIAAAKFAYLDWQKPQDRQLSQYWGTLNAAIENEFGKNSDESDRFAARTRGRPFRVPKTDDRINPNNCKGANYNGVMFSNKWLADDMTLDRDGINRLRPLVDEAHKTAGFGDGSPSDWWVIVLGDGDGMGKYVSGSKLHFYEKYLTETDAEKLIARDRYPDLNDAQYETQKQNFIAAFQGTGNEEEDRENPPLLKTRKRMGPATHVGLNRALLDFSNRLVPFITEKRFCGRVVYSGGDDVMAVLPLEDLPDYLLSLRSAWCGGKDPYEPQQGDPDVQFEQRGGYWKPISASGKLESLPSRPLFTMGDGATMSLGIVIAHKSVPLPAALDALWEAESERAKEMKGSPKGIKSGNPKYKPPKNGLCFRVLYGSGNCLEALMKGELFADWREWMQIETETNGQIKDPKIIEKKYQALSSLLYRLAEELPKHAAFTPSDHLIAKAAEVIAARRDEKEKVETNIDLLVAWLKRWEDWARSHYFEWKAECKKCKAAREAQKLEAKSDPSKPRGKAQKTEAKPDPPKPLGVDIEDLANLLRFSAFWLDKMQQRQQWHDK
ncbi:MULTISPECIES: type III-B CRISPR-associated protein Cas10/Cmr2 [Spirulina sp. CCY15215]|uniref:type III-B CRISPR-associated protein Cas10/Cmr2 n=1 Tax=Spirulina sp. CCY15215 TaxID=2767591 RepID=UPI00194DB32D|nr:type III-B CRISPR-associated protein Cas10/Cmr2 [Spirulina major]